MKVLFTGSAVLSHLYALVPLAQAVKASGHQVAFATAPSLMAPLEAEGFLCFPAGVDAAEEELKWRAQQQEKPSRAERVLFMWHHVFGPNGASRVADLQAIIDSWQPDLLLREDTELGGCAAADLAGIPHAAMQITAFRTNVYRLAVEQITKIRASVGLPSADGTDVLYRYLLLSARPKSLWDPAFPPPATTHLFKYPGLNLAGAEPLPDWVSELDADRPTVYATLGTVLNHKGDVYPAILDALQDEPVNLILTVGRMRDPLSFGERPPNVHIERYIPQNLVLPYCSLVVSHGGSGTVMDALSLGIPMVLIPVGADQPQNAQRCAELGVARVVDLEDPAQKNDVVSAIKGAAREVLANPSYKAAAGRIQEEIEAMPGLEYPISLLEKLAVERVPQPNTMRASVD